MEEIKCPNCGSIYVVFLRKQGIFLCEDCNHRFTPYREFKPHDETVMGQEVLQERELTPYKEPVEDKEFTPLRIFLSYGREDKYYPFIKGLKEDLKNKGHEVWLDIEHLKTGMVWAKEIEKGIEWASQAGDKGKFIFIMTPHSVRYPGADREDSGNFRDFSFCLNEITMAIEKGIDIFPIMLSTCKPPISIYHLQYLDMTDCLPLNQKQGRYRDKFNRLLLAVEEGKITYGGLQAMLRRYLNPVKFKRDIDRHLQKFTGRLWVFNKINEWLLDSEASRVFWITGNPGAGKTAIASWLYSNREDISALYLCDYGDEEKSKPGNLATSIAFQLSERFPDMQNKLGGWSDLENVPGMQDASKLFNELIVDKLPIDSPEQGQTHIILIDALDEITKGPKNEIASFISKEFDNLPTWLRIIITSRPEREVIKSLKRFDPFFLDCSRNENIEDIRMFIEREFSEFCEEEKIERDIVKKIIEKSEGVFLYVEYVRKELKRGSLSLENVDEFPIGLVGIYEDFFLRQFPVIQDKMRPGGHDIEFYKNKCRPALEVIASAREPLPIDIVSEIFHWRKYDRREVLGALGSLFPSEAGVLRPFHLSVLEWLTNEDDAGDYFIDTDEGHATLADYCWNEYKRWVDSGYGRKAVAKSLSSEEEKGKRKEKGKRIPYYPADISGYVLAYLPSHLIETGRWDDLETVLTDLRYIEAKCAEGMTYNLISDYKIALESFPEVQEEIRKKRQHDERIQRWIREIIEYSRKWNEARERNREELDRLGEKLKRATNNDERNRIRQEINNIMPSDEDIPLPEIPQSVKPWTEEEIRRDTERIKNNPTRIDRVRAFSQFVNSESHILLKSEYTTFPSFCIQRAYNYTDSGQFSNSAEKIINSEKNDIIFMRSKNNRHPYNPHTGLLKTMEVKGIISSVSVTPDGKYALSGGDYHILLLWDLKTGECVEIMEGHTRSITSVSITPDGKRAVSGSNDNTLRLWDLETGECLRIMGMDTGRVESVSITPDGKRAVSGSYYKTLRLWNLETGECLKVMIGHTDSVTCVSISPDGKMAVSGSYDKTVRLWDLESGECLKIMEGHTDWVWSVSITSDGKRAVSGGGILDKALRFWDLETGECLKIMEGHIDGIRSVSVTQDGKMAVSSSSFIGEKDKTVRLWDMEMGECLKIMEGHTHSVPSVSITPDGKYAVSGDKTLRLWDLETGKCLKIIERHTKCVTSISVTTDGKFAVSGSGDKTIRLWNLETGECLRRMEGHTAWVRSVSITPDGKRAVSGSSDDTLRLWDLETGECLKIMKGHAHGVGSVSITPDGKMVVSGSYYRALCLWNLETGECLRIMKGHELRVNSVSITPDWMKAVSGSMDGTLCLWDLETGKCLKIMEGHEDIVKSVSITPDGKYAVSGSLDKTPRLWDLETGKCLKIMVGHADSVWNTSITPDGKYAVSGSGDKTLRLWDLETGECLRVMEGHMNYVRSISITPDGERVVSGSDDKTLRLWDIETGECISIIEIGSPVLSISDIRPDGTLVCGTESGDVIILKIINIPMKSPIITPVRLWLYEGASLSGWDIPPTDYRDGDIPPTEIGKGNIPGKWDENITALCLWCGKRFIVDDQILNTIYRDGDVPPTEMAIRRNAIERKIKMEPSLRPSQITDISLPNSAYNNPRLLSKCPICKKPIRFNPFIVDNR